MGIVYKFRDYYGTNKDLDLYTTEDDLDGEKPVLESDSYYNVYSINAENREGLSYEGNTSFRIYWDVIDQETNDELKVCDWTKPYIISATCAGYIRVYADELTLRASAAEFFHQGHSVDFKKFTVRIPQELHRRAKLFVLSRGISLQDWMISLIEGAFLLEKAFPSSQEAGAFHTCEKD